MVETWLKRRALACRQGNAGYDQQERLVIRLVTKIVPFPRRWVEELVGRMVGDATCPSDAVSET